MIQADASWFICTGIILTLAALAAYFRGPIFALAVSIVASFVMPVWVIAQMFGIEVNLQTTGCGIGLLFLIVGAPRQIRSPIVLLDFCVAAMVVIQALSDSYHGSSAFLALLKAYGEWGFPYVAGRFVMRDPRWLEPVAICCCIAAIVLGVGGAVETVSGMNVWELLVGDRPVDGAPRLLSRFGFKRAFGPTRHSIYYGMQAFTLFPWSIALWNWSKKSQVQSLSVSGGLGTIAGVLSSVARTPIICLPLAALITTAFWSYWLRWLLVGLFAVIASWFAFDTERFLTTVESLGAESRRVTGATLDGDRITLSSARHRILIFQVYWPAMREAGCLGYGTQALSELPPRVPHLPANEKLREKLKYLDNAYVFNVLRFGWLGMAAFVSLILVAIWTGIQVSWDRSIQVFAACMVGMTVAVAAALGTVWFAYDFGFELLWSFGILAGLAIQQTRSAGNN